MLLQRHFDLKTSYDGVPEPGGPPRALDHLFGHSDLLQTLEPFNASKCQCWAAAWQPIAVSRARPILNEFRRVYKTKPLNLPDSKNVFKMNNHLYGETNFEGWR